MSFNERMIIWIASSVPRTSGKARPKRKRRTNSWTTASLGETIALLLCVLSLPLINDLQSFLSSLDSTQSHCSEGRAHTVGSIHLAQLHAADDEALDDFPGSLHDGVLRSAHVQAPHAAELLKLLHTYEALDGESTEGTIVTGGRDDKRCIDGVRVHAGLVVVMHGDKGPVGHHTSNADSGRVGRSWGGTGDEVLDGSGVEELDVGEGENLGKEGGCEECLVG